MNSLHFVPMRTERKNTKKRNEITFVNIKRRRVGGRGEGGGRKNKKKVNKNTQKFLTGSFVIVRLERGWPTAARWCDQARGRKGLQLN